MIADEMRDRLGALNPTRLDIIDESEGHRGHAGFREGGESHFRIRMASAEFAGKGRLAQHRMVHAALGDIVPRIHALALELAES
ncbi:BolA family protein [Paracoccus sp. 1_MG-2023]|uniref:BolA family protein n=1 Tax=unclassified Paracoccus (in: a-proteobacteria) TaxID=2688777 RepID=UPI001C089A3B|nr:MULTISPECIES: BolA family protein [unclassified Paracoccus (in: a-proteobacteria)]MBU2956448.1 BolA family transcriptional regulator [Paracoccus sp. C2R09]MDO6669747.1 BolA family protein [Paracoccus sp. 1_MG-2023]